jgi:hypothetical protein
MSSPRMGRESLEKRQHQITWALLIFKGFQLILFYQALQHYCIGDLVVEIPIYVHVEDPTFETQWCILL